MIMIMTACAVGERRERAGVGREKRNKEALAATR
jgi:hypothetical protein